MVFIEDTNPPSGMWPTVVRRSRLLQTCLLSGKSHALSSTVPTITRSFCLRSNRIVRAPVGMRLSLSEHSDQSVLYRPSGQRFRPHSQHRIVTPKTFALIPGVYNLSQPIVIRNPNTVIFGLGLATLVLTQGTPALIIADVDGVTIAGLLFDAGASNSTNLLQIGDVMSVLSTTAPIRPPYSTFPVMLVELL